MADNKIPDASAEDKKFYNKIAEQHYDEEKKAWKTQSSATSAGAAPTETPKAPTNFDLARNQELHSEIGSEHRDKIKMANTSIGEIDTQLKAEGLEAAEKAKLETNRGTFTQNLEAERKALDDLGKEKFKDLGRIEQGKAAIGGNFNKNASWLNKGMRIAGTGVGIGSIVLAGKEVISPQVNPETGKEEIKWVKALGMLTAGLAATYFSLIHGGRAKAQGIA